MPISPNGRCCDLHTHTRFSVDSSASLEAMCRRAIHLGLHQIAFTEHVDYVPADIGYGFFRPVAFLAEIARCRKLFEDRLTILAGVEIGELDRFRAQADALLGAYSFDLVIGSLHWVDDDLVFESSYFRGRSEESAFRGYFAAVERMCRRGGFDVLGHLDVVKRYGYDVYGRADLSPFEADIRPILEAIIQHGIALEINTSTLRRPVDRTSPDALVLGWYREMGGELVTFGSDAHRPADLACGWERASEMIRAAGFPHLTTFVNRIPQAVPWESR
jgi:histidinol-phosphatase (PHP family)